MGDQKKKWLVVDDEYTVGAIWTCIGYAKSESEPRISRAKALMYIYEHFLHEDILGRMKMAFTECSSPDEQVGLLLRVLMDILREDYGEHSWDNTRPVDAKSEEIVGDSIQEQESEETMMKDIYRVFLVGAMLVSLCYPWYCTLLTTVLGVVASDYLTTAHGTGPVVMCGEKIVSWSAARIREYLEEWNSSNNGVPVESTVGGGPEDQAEKCTWPPNRHHKRLKNSEISIYWVDRSVLILVVCGMCVMPHYGQVVAVVFTLTTGVVCNPILHWLHGNDHPRMFTLRGSGTFKQRVKYSQDLLGWKTHRRKILNHNPV